MQENLQAFLFLPCFNKISAVTAKQLTKWRNQILVAYVQLILNCLFSLNLNSNYLKQLKEDQIFSHQFNEKYCR